MDLSIVLIENYFHSELSQDLKLEFERRCESDKVFAKKVAVYVALHDHLQEQWVKHKRTVFDKLDDNLSTNKKHTFEHPNYSLSKSAEEPTFDSESVKISKPTSEIVLSALEKSFLRLFAEENSDTQIAEILFISLEMVRRVRKDLIQRLGVENSQELAEQASRYL